MPDLLFFTWAYASLGKVHANIKKLSRTSIDALRIMIASFLILLHLSYNAKVIDYYHL
tara:strand:- start:988 stop:1161 length:174 start_codon:yes stop_codon:yes gene_type:complete